MAAISTNAAEKKAPKGKSETPWSLHIRSFWKITFINPPECEASCQAVKLQIYRRFNDDAKVSKFAICVNRKSADIVPNSGTP
jgi:hypothetical protein